MADSSANPFASQQSTSAPAPDDTTARPFGRAAAGVSGGGGDANLSRQLRRQVRDLAKSANVSVTPTPRAGDLTVKDLNDLAAEFSGVATSNPKVSSLTIEDLNSVEAVFYDVKMNAAKAARESAASGGTEQAPIFDNWSCCCCTPCCSCAAAETSPFAS
jgi:sulfite reductase beta subunit-like hemoprotein